LPWSDPGLRLRRPPASGTAIIEVLSPATAAHDQVRKRDLYERAGVREYWLVHPTDRIIMLYRLKNNRYGRPDIAELVGETMSQAVPGVIIQWERVTRRLPTP
jgi:Uma2 family endonuclease